MKKIALLLFVLSLAVLPFISQAEEVTELTPGMLVKSASSSAVYYIDEDLTRHVFPNGRIFRSWFENFDGIVEVSSETLAEYPLAGMIPYKPGKLLVKIISDPRVYAVDEGGVLRWVKNEKVARALYGLNWNQFVQDLSDAFFTEYEVGDDIEDETAFDAGQGKKKGHIIKTLRAKRLHKLHRRGASEDEIDNRGYGRNKIAVCHKFKKKGQHTIYIGAPALSAHLRHGDAEGPCADDDGDSGDDDSDGDSGDSGDDDSGDSGSGDDTDTTSPVFQAKTVEDVTDTTAHVTFTTDEEVTATVYFALTSPVDVGSTAMSVDAGTAAATHDVELTGLDPETTYYFVVMVEDASGNTTTSGELSFTTEATPDTTAPVISDIVIDSVTDTTANVAWETDEAADAVVYFSTVSPLDVGSAASETVATVGTSHSVELTGLDAVTDYYVVIVAADVADNEATSDEQTFTTEATP